jgi:AraC family transcriptional regulator of adaptative response/methylated-DNA-[protein]-cysteine methyltransferase
MTTMSLQPESTRSVTSDEERWQAVVRRDRGADGRFFYSVKTTGVYCRPSCAARLARRENVEFHSTPAEAERAGYRACKRCKPDELSAGAGHARAVAKACRLIEEADEAPDLNALAAAIDMSPSHFHRIFKSLTGLTPKAYATARRSRRVREELPRSDTVTSAIYNAGFNSSGRFYATSAKVLGMKPAAYRAGGAGASIRFAVGACSLGSVLVAASEHGVCAIKLGDDPGALVQDLREQFPRARLTGGDRDFEKWVARVIAFVERPAIGLDLPLDVRGTAFQQRVWQKLREIPCGKTLSYAQIAEDFRPEHVHPVHRARVVDVGVHVPPRGVHGDEPAARLAQPAGEQHLPAQRGGTELLVTHLHRVRVVPLDLPRVFPGQVERLGRAAEDEVERLPPVLVAGGNAAGGVHIAAESVQRLQQRPAVFQSARFEL